MLCAPPIFDFSDTTKQFQIPIHMGFEDYFSWYSKFDSIIVSAPCDVPKKALNHQLCPNPQEVH